MIVVATRRQRQDQLARGVDPGLALAVRETHDAIGVGNVELVADERHAERLVQVFEEGLTDLGRAISVSVTQQRESVGAHPDRAGRR